MESLIFNIYHNNCNDGILSAAIVYKYAKKNNIQLESYPMNYNDNVEPLYKNLELLSLTNKVHVIFSDFSLHKTNIENICNIVNQVTILDHHATAKDHLYSLDINNLQIVFDMSRAGCQITWDHLFEKGKTTCKRPIIIDYIADRDLWNFDYPETKPLTAVIRSYGMEIEKWADYLDPDYDISYMVNEGIVVQNFLDSTYVTKANELVDNIPKEIPVVINLTDGISEILNKVVEHKNYKHKFAISYKLKLIILGDQVPIYKIVYSVRSKDNESARKVAEHFGGGGHPNAAGFESNLHDLPQIISEINSLKLK